MDCVVCTASGAEPCTFAVTRQDGRDETVEVPVCPSCRADLLAESWIECATAASQC